MISLEDCIAFCGLDADEVAAVAEHEHVPDIVAAEIAHGLLQSRGGAVEIRRMLVDDFEAALVRRDRRHAAQVLLTLRRFLSEHPEAVPRA